MTCKLLAVLLTALCVALVAPQSHKHQHPRQIRNDFYMGSSPFLLIIYDGFRHDYPEIYAARGVKLPNFQQFMKEGVRATRVRNVFPTITFPNHQSLVTGLYAESHGVVANNFVDPKYNYSLFAMANQTTLNQDFWNDGQPEPIYITNQRQGGHSAVMLYPNSDSKYGGLHPFVQVDQYWTLNGFPALYPYKERVDKMVYWLEHRDLYDINLGILYFDQPDEFGHIYGHNSTEVGQKLQELDFYFGYLVSELKKRNLYDNLNIVVTADHGMATNLHNETIYLDNIVPKAWYDNLIGSTWSMYLFLYPKPGKAAAIVSAVKKYGKPYLHAYTKDTMPKGFHIANNRRTAPLLILCDAPYMIQINASVSENTAKYGVHGYSPNNTDMWPIWMARGPAFKSGAVVNSQLESVDVYPLMCSLLGLAPNPNNGSLKRINVVLRQGLVLKLEDGLAPLSFMTAFVVLLTLMFCMFLIITCVYICSHFSPRPQPYVMLRK